MRLLMSLLAIVLTFPVSSFCQSSLDSLQLFHQENLATITLLKNEQHLLPFKDLSTTSIAHLSIGKATNTAEFDHFLKQYTNVKSYNLPLTANGQQAGEIFKYLINYSDLTIISVNEPLDTGYSLVIEEFIRDLSTRVDICLLYTSPSPRDRG